MSFAARCPFCHIKINGVPAEHEGGSICCPRCESYFTPVAASDPPPGIRGRIPAQGAAALAPQTMLTEGNAPPPSSAFAGKPEEGGPTSSTATGPSSPINRFGVLSFFLGALALLCASVPGARFLMIPLAGAGALMAGVGIAIPKARKAGLRLVAAGAALSLAMLLITCCWPTLLHLPTQTTDGRPSSDAQLVYHRSRPRNFQRLAPKESEWVNASQDGIQQAGVRVRLNGVAVMPVALQDSAGRRRRGERSLVIRLRISNAEADRLVEYQGWSAATEKIPRLEDDKGKSYALKRLDPDQAVGQVRHAWLPMAKWVDDVLVFEAPAGPIEWLRLELPCTGVGLPGQFRLEIPRRLIAFQ